MTATPLTFGTAGLRGPMREGLDAMNVTTVSQATWAVAKVLKDRGLGGSTVVVGRDARHHSDEFAIATAEILAAQGFSVTLLPHAAPTPVLAYATRQRNAVAGVQITASHNPPADNGYKVYFDGGIQIVPPTDLDIETAMQQAPTDIARQPVTPTDEALVEQYASRAAGTRSRSQQQNFQRQPPSRGRWPLRAMNQLAAAPPTNAARVPQQPGLADGWISTP